MQILMAGAAQQDTVRHRPAAELTTVPHVMHLMAPPTATRATTPPVPAPDGRADRAGRLRELRAAFAVDHDGGLRFREAAGALDRHRGVPKTAIVRSAQMRTPGISTVPFNARTTPPSLG